MKRTAIPLLAWLVMWGSSPLASAQDTAGDEAADKAAAAPAEGEGTAATTAPAEAGAGEEGQLTPGAEPDLNAVKADVKQAKEAGAAAGRLAWQDIVVVPRKPFLKSGRVELAPIFGVNVNDILIRHWMAGAELTYFLTDALAVGVQGQYFMNSTSDQAFLVGQQFNRIPTLNAYKYGGALNFSYVPWYGKFSLFNKDIFHWEIIASAGVGVTRTEIMPRDPSMQKFGTNALTANFGIGSRLFVFPWMTINVALRDYVLNDRYEPSTRSKEDSLDVVTANADKVFVHNVMFYLGAGFYLPTSFNYHTAR